MAFDTTGPAALEIQSRAGRPKRLAGANVRLGEIAASTTLVVVSLLVTAGALELGYRLWLGPQWLLNWNNAFAGERRRMAADASLCSYIHNPTLGWAPNPNFRSVHFSVGPDGTRKMPALATSSPVAPVILATGDSFAEGLEVDDDQSWPAYLQERLHIQTLNAGVSGFGLDQTLLRTEEMVATHPVALAVVSFIVDDIRRTEHDRAWSADKPYFELEGEELQLRNSPVPTPSHAPCELSLWQRLFGSSMILQRVANRLGWIHSRALPPGTGRELACPIMNRLAKITSPVLVVAQYDAQTWLHGEAYRDQQHAEARRVLDCAADAGLATLDTFEFIQKAVDERGVSAFYRLEGAHHSPAGNQLVAKGIADKIGHGVALKAGLLRAGLRKPRTPRAEVSRP